MKRGTLKRKTPLKASKRSFTHASRKPKMKPRRTKREKTIPVSRLKKKLWELCKLITRKNYGYKCYTCGQETEHPHTGHFISSSVCSAELRYSLDNLRPQCYRCNIHLSGNWLTYEQKLAQENGKEWVENLKRKNQETKGLQYDSLWYKAKIQEYQTLLINLEK